MLGEKVVVVEVVVVVGVVVEIVVEVVVEVVVGVVVVVVAYSYSVTCHCISLVVLDYVVL